MLEVKILMRRAKCYEMQGEVTKARDDLDRCLIMEPKEGEAKDEVDNAEVTTGEVLEDNALSEDKPEDSDKKNA